MDKLLSEQKILEAIDNLKANFTCYDSVTLDEVASHVKAIPSADMFSDLKAEISMYENSEQSIDEMIQGIKSIISIYER